MLSETAAAQRNGPLIDWSGVEAARSPTQKLVTCSISSGARSKPSSKADLTLELVQIVYTSLIYSSNLKKGYKTNISGVSFESIVELLILGWTGNITIFPSGLRPSGKIVIARPTSDK